MSKVVPIVAIVGRANVGKSSLYNAVLGRREAVIAKEAGTTRDSISAKATWGDQDFWLVDTAGLKTATDDFEITIQDQIAQATKSANLIWVVVEASGGPGHEDRLAAKLALKTKRPVMLVINKTDTARGADLADWQKLGIKSIRLTSATQKKGLEELLKATAEQLPTARLRQDSDRIQVAILGRPNVGKSALFNTLAKKQQAVVSEQAGTTRDVNRLAIRYQEREIELADTAGIRRSGKIAPGVERFSVLRALQAIEQSLIVLLIMGVSEPSVGLDQKIAGLVKEAGKGLIIVVNKWDLAQDLGIDREQIASQIRRDFAFTPWAPLIFTSALSGLNVTKIFDLVIEIAKVREAKVKTTQLNSWLQKVTDQHPPAGLKNTHPRLRYMVQETAEDAPSFKIFGAHTKLLHWSYRRYLERSFRASWPFEGTPIKFWFIDKPLKS